MSSALLQRTALSDLGPRAAYVRPHTIAPDLPRFHAKLAALRAGGPRALMCVADFDYTLSMPGGLSSWSIIDSSERAPAEFREECLAMARKFFPIEVRHTQSISVTIISHCRTLPIVHIAVSM